MELALGQKYGQVSLLALDWQKAFDAIHQDALIMALKRFGLPAHVLEVIRGIYSGRRFQVKDGSDNSNQKKQRSGGSQGCPLSPFLFFFFFLHGEYNMQNTNSYLGE